MNVSRKYEFLRIIAQILKVLAWVVLGVGLLGGLIGLLALAGPMARNLNLPVAVPSLGSVGVLLLSVAWFVQLFAFGSILSLLIDIEENTRALATQGQE